MRALVVGTAGHIDHGKTSLIRALTGVDTDQLKEEKQRGISIDLGFAELRLPDGPTVSFVDVPGHERFVRNMVAGASGIEAVMLIVAANESVKPQTREHLEICQVLGITQGLVVITKCDLAAPAQMLQTKADIRALVAGSFLEGAPVSEVSAVTGAGIGKLVKLLSAIVATGTRRNELGLVRLPIDRSFAIKGFGTVVTGTLASGCLKVGDLVEIHPDKRQVRVRALQAQHLAVAQGLAGQRLAVNLAGIDQHAVRRGYVLTIPDSLAPVRVLDVKIRWLDRETVFSPRELFVIHSGTSETSARISKIGVGSNGSEFARLRLNDAIVAVPGDRLVIRRPSPAQTVAGAEVIDAFPPLRLNKAKTSARLQILQRDPVSRIELLVSESKLGITLRDLTRVTGLSGEELLTHLRSGGEFAVSSDDRVVTSMWVKGKRAALLKWLEDFHRTNPNAPGAPLSAAKRGLPSDLAALIFKDFAEISLEGDLIALKGHKAAFTADEQKAASQMEMAFRTAGFQPPSTGEVIAASGINAQKARALLETLIKNKRLVRLPDDLVFHAEVIDHIRNSLASHKGRKFSVAEFKSWINISRKYAIPLLEYMDQMKITRRDGDSRVVI